MNFPNLSTTVTTLVTSAKNITNMGFALVILLFGGVVAGLAVAAGLAEHINGPSAVLAGAFVAFVVDQRISRPSRV